MLSVFDTRFKTKESDKIWIFVRNTTPDAPINNIRHWEQLLQVAFKGYIYIRIHLLFYISIITDDDYISAINKH